MPQKRDPIVYQVQDRLRAAPFNMLITPKAAQPTRRTGVLQPVMYIDVVSTMNPVHNGGVVDLGFMVGANIVWSRTFVMPTATYWFRNHVHWTLTSDYQVVARFRVVAEGVGNYLNDVVQMNVNGYYLEEYTSP